MSNCSCCCHDCNEHNHEHDHNHSHGTASKKLTITLLISSAVLFILGASIPFPDIVKYILFGASVLLAAYDILLDGFLNIFKLKLEEETLLLIAVVAAFILGDTLDCAILAILFKVGRMIEEYAITKSKKSTDRLSEIRPEYANKLNSDGTTTEVKACEIEIGDKFILRAGDRIPLDCKVLEGRSSVDTSTVTGESIPLWAEPDTELLSGSVNLDGVLTCIATQSYQNSAATKIVEMVFNSTANKTETEKFITRFSRYYTPIVIIIAVLLSVIPPLLGIYDFQTWISRALIFLIASCPCAIVISVPLSFFSTIGALSKNGVLTKGTSYIEAMAKIQNVAFDKTGTLTSGNLKIADMEIIGDYEKEYILKLAASLERFSSHPTAKAIVDAYGSDDFFTATDVKEISGLGITGIADSKKLACGNKKITSEKAFIPDADIYLFYDNKIIATFYLQEDIPKQNLKLAKRLKNIGINKVVMLTGAGKEAADKVADECNIREYYHSLLPENKVEKVAELQQQGSCLFVGDGINDAPVLATADVGVSMGLGSEIANSSSDVILSLNRLSDIVNAIKISRRGMATVRFNIIFALIIKFAVLVLGALGLSQMWMAVFADIGVTIITVLNSIRLLNYK